MKRLAANTWNRSPRGWLAVVFDAEGPSWALARPAADGWRVARAGRSVLPGGTPATGVVVADSWAAELRAERKTHHDRIVTTVAAGDVMLQVLALPAATPDELRQMLALQIDQLSPLAGEEMVYDFEPLGRDNGQVRVLVAIAHKAAVDHRVAALETAGLPADVVDVDVLAWFRALRRQQALPADDRLHALILVDTDAAHLLVQVGGELRAVRTFLFQPAAALPTAAPILTAGAPAREPGPAPVVATAATTAVAGPDWGALLAEWRRSLVALQVDPPAREPGEVAFLVLAEAWRPTVQDLAANWPGAKLLDGGSLSALAASLSLDQTAPVEQRLNLLPAAWRARRQRAKTRRLLVRVGILAAAVYLVSLLGLVGARFWRRAQLDGLQRQTRQLQPGYLQARQLQSELAAMQRQLGDQGSALEILREISTLLPENVKLSSFVFRRDENVTLRGQADSAPAVNEFVAKLETSPLFAKVAPGSIAAAGDLTKFDLVATLATVAHQTPGKTTGSP